MLRKTLRPPLLKVHSHQAKAKAKTFFFLWNFLFDLFRLFFDLFRWVFDLFRFRIRLVWMGRETFSYLAQRYKPGKYWSVRDISSHS